MKRDTWVEAQVAYLKERMTKKPMQLPEGTLPVWAIYDADAHRTQPLCFVEDEEQVWSKVREYLKDGQRVALARRAYVEIKGRKHLVNITSFTMEKSTKEKEDATKEFASHQDTQRSDLVRPRASLLQARPVQNGGTG